MGKNILATLAAAIALLTPLSGKTTLLTDITVFSSNSEGNNWNGLIWNTQGEDTDTPTPGRWNLYISQDPLSDTTPVFINGFNDSRTRITLPLIPGNQTFSIYGNGVGLTFDPLQHFVLNLYFDGVQSAPGISGVQNLSNDNLAAAGHPNALNIFGNSGHQEAGTLFAAIGNQLIALTAFSWITDVQRDIVWPYWANDPDYSNGGAGPDYYGSFALSVRSVPEPATLALVGLSLAGLGFSRRQR
jgi:hypothetical protein